VKKFFSLLPAAVIACAVYGQMPDTTLSSDSLDQEIAASRDARDKADKLLLRVQALLQIHYDTVLNQNLSLLRVPRGSYNAGFNRETDAEKRYQFLTTLRKDASLLVTDRKAADAKSWMANPVRSLRSE